EGLPCPNNESDDNPFGFDANVFPHECGFNNAPAGMPNTNPLTKRGSEHNIGLWGRDVDMESVAIQLLGYADRPIVDRTGLRESVDFKLDCGNCRARTDRKRAITLLWTRTI